MTKQSSNARPSTESPPPSSEGDAYDRTRARWEAVWRDSFGALAIEVDGWTSPWLDESWRDGNPIFSAWSPVLGRGIRVLHQDQEQDQAGPFTHWEDSLGDGSDSVQELVIACAMTDDAIDRAAELWRRWASGGSSRVVTRTPRQQEVLLARQPVAA